MTLHSPVLARVTFFSSGYATKYTRKCLGIAVTSY